MSNNICIMNGYLKVTEIRPGMVYQGQLIVAIEFFGNLANLYFEDNTKVQFAKDSYLMIDQRSHEYFNHNSS